MDRFLELTAKEVINTRDGRRLGRVVDMQVNFATGQVVALVVQDDRRRGVFRGRDEYIVPWAQICKFGDDTILIEAAGMEAYEP